MENKQISVNELELSIIENALLDYMDDLEKALIKKMSKCGFSDYKAPTLGIETDETFIQAAKHYYPNFTERYLAACNLYEKI